MKWRGNREGRSPHVGLPDAAVRESRDRVRTGIKNSGYIIPPTVRTNLGGSEERGIRFRPSDCLRQSSEPMVRYASTMSTSSFSSASRASKEAYVPSPACCRLLSLRAKRGSPISFFLLPTHPKLPLSPRHTISDAGLIGGGIVPRTGRSLSALNGLLFLDELPEFPRERARSDATAARRR